MPEEPQIEILSYKRRKSLFILLVLIFLVALPSMIFYTTGYRISFDNDETSIVTTGGIYITTDNVEVDVYLDEQLVEKPRFFRSAYYIQNIEAGVHNVVVQNPQLHTWVKELPVDSRMVIEAAAFNMPLIPRLRPITEYESVLGEQVFLEASTTEFIKGTTTVPFIATTTSATSTYTVNQEFEFVDSLFATTSTSSRSVFDRFLEGVERFRFATTSEATTTQEVEDFIERGDMRLVDREGEVFAVWLNEVNNIPHYFCVPRSSLASTSERYGEHVAEGIERVLNATSTDIVGFIESDRVCRNEIKLNRLQQDVYYYNFIPNTSDLVLLQLEDGLYVSEVDDRAWQNVQQVYESDDFSVLVENGLIYIYDDGYYYELITQIEDL